VNATKGAICPESTQYYDFMNVPRVNGQVWTHEDTRHTSDALARIQAAGFENFVQNIAASLTKAGLDYTNDTVKGTVSVTEVYVNVTWPFTNRLSHSPPCLRNCVFGRDDPYQ
jgi:hypothetical protein